MAGIRTSSNFYLTLKPLDFLRPRFLLEAIQYRPWLSTWYQHLRNKFENLNKSVFLIIMIIRQSRCQRRGRLLKALLKRGANKLASRLVWWDFG